MSTSGTEEKPNESSGLYQCQYAHSDLYHDFTRLYHWGNMCKEFKGYLCFIFYNCICTYLKIKSLIKKPKSAARKIVFVH